ncbi:CAP domain-containing protein [Bacillus songklensis]|uniref:CAP domain-containing protein n=1 Tax=Bacillus songklensis TaxID=1069116 RepID=A0ABV8B506_9BACI
MLVVTALFLYIYNSLPVFQSKEANFSLEQQQERVEQKVNKSIEGENIFQFMGKNQEEIIGMLGEPERIDPSAYDYEWWIYKNGVSSYMQIGIADSRVVTVYATGDELDAAPFQIGEQRDDLEKKVSMDSEVQLDYNGGDYRFELSGEDQQKSPLVRYNQVFVQLYFDHFLNTLSSIRIMDEETLLKQRPYELSYRGPLVNPKPLDDQQWHQVEEGAEKQILDITNVIRAHHELKPLLWNEKAANVAYKHSKDMSDHRYFSHVSPIEGDLGNRLKEGNVPFTMARENIAAQYQDGAAAVEGWLNSEGHRKALLNKDFTYLGVGVYQKYYTQNFIRTLP